MSRNRGRAKPAPHDVRPASLLPHDVSSLIEAGHLPAPHTAVRVRFPGTEPFMSGTVDGYAHVDGVLHLRIERMERLDDGGVRRIRRLIAWSAIESVSWDVAVPRTELDGGAITHDQALEALGVSA